MHFKCSQRENAFVFEVKETQALKCPLMKSNHPSVEQMTRQTPFRCHPAATLWACPMNQTPEPLCPHRVTFWCPTRLFLVCPCLNVCVCARCIRASVFIPIKNVVIRMQFRAIDRLDLLCAVCLPNATLTMWHIQVMFLGETPSRDPGTLRQWTVFLRKMLPLMTWLQCWWWWASLITVKLAGVVLNPLDNLALLNLNVDDSDYKMCLFPG